MKAVLLEFLILPGNGHLDELNPSTPVSQWTGTETKLTIPTPTRLVLGLFVVWILD